CSSHRNDLFSTQKPCRRPPTTPAAVARHPECRPVPPAADKYRASPVESRGCQISFADPQGNPASIRRPGWSHRLAPAVRRSSSTASYGETPRARYRSASSGTGTQACTSSSPHPSSRPRKYPRCRDKDSRHNAFPPRPPTRPSASDKEDQKNQAARLSHLCRWACWLGVRQTSDTTREADPCWSTASAG